MPNPPANYVTQDGTVHRVQPPAVTANLQSRLAAAEQRATEAERHLGNLLARIHGDGGHYQQQHGTDKAALDADAKVCDLHDRATEAVELLKRLASLAEWAGQTDNDDVVAARAFLARLTKKGATDGEC